MKRTFLIANLLTLILLSVSCKSYTYIFDKDSYQRQQEITTDRNANIGSSFALGFGIIMSQAILNTDIDLDYGSKQYKKIKLYNTTSDTMYVNLLSDILFNDSTYCDFLDIRIPPNEKSKLVVPLNANYNVYFSTTPDSTDDEMITISTNDIKDIKLYPGLSSSSRSTDSSQ